MASNARHQHRRSRAGVQSVSVVPFPGSWSATHDPRWSAVSNALTVLRDKGRHAVRIVDADCAAGSLLLHALHHARRLGFTAIEGRGVDGSPALIGRARAAAARTPDIAIGVVYEVADIRTVLEQEAEFPADIVLCPVECSQTPALSASLLRAAKVVIGDAECRRLEESKA